MNMNALVQPKPLSYSLSMSLLFHALIILMLGRNFLFETIPPPLNESQSQFRIIAKKPPPPPATKQKIQEVKIEEPISINPVEVQPVAMKPVLTPTASVAFLPMEVARIEPVKMSLPSTSRTQIIEFPVSSLALSAVAKPMSIQADRGSPREYGRKALIQNGASASFVHKLNIATPQAQSSTMRIAHRMSGIRSLASVKVFTLDSPGPIGATPNPVMGSARSDFLQSKVTAFSTLETTPRSHTGLTDKAVLSGFLQGVQKAIASAKYYPEGERQAKHTGKMKVAFTLLRNGQIEKLRLKVKSKYDLLNQAALDAVSQVVPFSGFPSGIIEDAIDVVIPFRFDLT